MRSPLAIELDLRFVPRGTFPSESGSDCKSLGIRKYQLKVSAMLGFDRRCPVRFLFHVKQFAYSVSDVIDFAAWGS
jgi:hypothetical protein